MRARQRCGARWRRLADDAGRRRLQCRPIVTPAPLPTPRPNTDEQRAQERGAQRGKLEIILAWDDRNDLDLRVICPNGRDFIGYEYIPQRPIDHPRACGGTRDVDANGDANTATATPVENVFFADPAAGRYRVTVFSFAMRVSQSSHFRVTVRREGQPDQVFTGTALNGPVYTECCHRRGVRPMSGSSMLDLIETRDGTLRPLMPEGRDAAAWHGAMTAEIATHLTPAHAALLAMPARTQTGWAWRAAGEDQRSFTDLAASDRRALTTAIGTILSDIRRLGESGRAPAVAAGWPALREYRTGNTCSRWTGAP